MSCPIKKEQLDQLKFFIDICKKNPNLLHQPELDFFKSYIESFGGKIPEVSPEGMSEGRSTPQQPQDVKMDEPEVEEESEPESDLELDNEGCVEPDIVDDNQKMGDSTKEVSEEDTDKADEKRREAMSQFSEGNFDKAIELFTEAIELNPHLALLFAKRGQTYIKLNKPNACIKDCTKALELNPDSAAAYKFRGRAYRLLGEWEKAAKDLRQACKIDFDEQTDEWLREVTPNAKKIELHILKQERKRLEKEEREKKERIRKAREAHARAAHAENEHETGGSGGPGGAAGLGDFYKLLQDPEIMAAFQDPEVAQAFQDISTNPANIAKYQSNPKIMDLMKKLSSKFSNMPGFPGAFGGGPGGMHGAGGFPGSFPGFPGGFPGAGGNPTEGTKPPEDDNLD